MANKPHYRKSPYWKKQEAYDRDRLAMSEYPHIHRRVYPRVKKRFKRMERRVAQSIVDRALLQDRPEEVSNVLLKTVAIRLKGPQRGALPLREIVAWKLERRVAKHGARKRRFILLGTPTSELKSK